MTGEEAFLGEHPLIHGGDSSRVGNPVPGDGFHDGGRVKSVLNNQRCPRQQEALQGNHRIFVKERNRDQGPVFGNDGLDLPHEVGIPVLTCVGQENAFGSPGRPRGVRLETDAIGRRSPRRAGCHSTGDGGVIDDRSAGPPTGRRDDRAQAGQPGRCLNELAEPWASHERHHDLGVVNDESKEVVAGLWVKGNHHGPSSDRPENDFDVAVVVAKEDGHPIARLDPVGDTGGRHLVGPAVELPIADLNVVLNHRRRVRSRRHRGRKEIAEIPIRRPGQA